MLVVLSFVLCKLFVLLAGTPQWCKISITLQAKELKMKCFLLLTRKPAECWLSTKFQLVPICICFPLSLLSGYLLAKKVILPSPVLLQL